MWRTDPCWVRLKALEDPPTHLCTVRSCPAAKHTLRLSPLFRSRLLPQNTGKETTRKNSTQFTFPLEPVFLPLSFSLSLSRCPSSKFHPRQFSGFGSREEGTHTRSPLERRKRDATRCNFWLANKQHGRVFFDYLPIPTQ